MARYEEPRCQAIDRETEAVCGVRMKVLGERDPSFGPNWRPGHYVFKCPRCGSVRALDAANLDRYATRTK
jgi:hypothetical protein